MKMKTYAVFGKFGTFFGYVRAEKKGYALFLAERDLKAGPGCYVGRVD
jgi:hypothetical protein